MFSKQDHNFIQSFLNKMTCLVSDDMYDDNTTCDDLERRAAELEVTVDELIQQIEG